MPDLLGGRALRDLLADHGVKPRRQLGQNFVTDPNTIHKVVQVAGIGPGDDVLEIGAGAGSLTLGLASAAHRVVAVETDPALIEVLGEVLAGVPNVDVVRGDATALDLASIEASCLVANLPYNIAATVIVRVLEEAPQIRRLTVMVQREVGERLAAVPGSRTYGATSALVAYWARARVAARIGRGSFFPTPEVESVLVALDRHPPLEADPSAYKRVVRAAFVQRRKTLRNSLAGLFGSPAGAESALAEAGIEPAARAEQVDAAGFARLAACLDT